MLRCAFAVACALVMLLPRPGSARPAHKQALAQYFGAYLPKKLNDCRTCHVAELPKETAEGERPHNVFGARLSAVRDELRKTGKKTSIDSRLEAILHEDADGDGVSNLLEILAGHFPGDKNDQPAAAKLLDAQTLAADFARFKAGYPWRPFEIVTRPAVPTVKDASWVRNPLDAFIAAEHEARGLKPRPAAPREVLLRRAYLDLIGLPPTPAELHAFLKDDAPDAYEKLVERLLNSPHYGERWGRHWMDVWRYSDWAGFGAQIRDSQPHIWRWRDWIIESLNEDKPYDRMVMEMLAGDELAPEDPKALTGTGYLVRNWKLLSREKWLQDTVEHTFMAFQGLTIGCAKCHDHMYDPLLQTDYYQVRAIFEPHNVRTDRIPGKPDTKVDGIVRAFDKDLTVPTYLFVRGDDRTPDKSKPLAPGVPESLGGTFSKLNGVVLPPSAVVPDKRPFVIEETVAASAGDINKAREEAATMVKKHEARKGLSEADLVAAKQKEFVPAPKTAQAKVAWREAAHEALLRTLAAEKLEDGGMKDSEAWKKAATAARAAQVKATLAEARYNLMLAENKLSEQQLLKKVDPAAQKDVDAKKVALTAAEKDNEQPAGTNYKPRTLTAYPAQSTGRRLALARWLADKQNPLTARVAVNHIWLRHFGQALVPSVFDFGRNGRPPSHPALLDWLAAEFMERNWKMKDIHRLILTSNAYRQASTPDEANLKIDRDNKYLWRFAPRQAEAEVVRDCIFHVAGKLDLTMGGPEFDFPLGLKVSRRSVYFRHAAEKQMEFMQIFDGPSVTECYERKHAIVPQQALALINSEVTLKHARILARKIAAAAKEDAAFVTRAFEHTLTRLPIADELEDCLTFLKEQTQRLANVKAPAGANLDGAAPAANAALRARENLVHVLLNHHEFVTIR